MNHRENYLRAATFKNPAWIPCSMAFSPLIERRYHHELCDLMRDHPRIFPEYDDQTRHGEPAALPPGYREGERFVDSWGCTWNNAIEGLEGIVVGHPLADWRALETWRPPDPRTKSERGDRDWTSIRGEVIDRRRKGLLTHGSAERLFDRLYFLRGFENLMMDFAEQTPMLDRLISILERYEHEVVDLWLDIGVDLISFHTDIGTQSGLMISPEAFRRHLKPMFKSLFTKIRDAGSIVLLSSDGNISEIVEDLVECGLHIHDPQLRATGIDTIKRHYRGKLCACVDLDRQSFPFSSPQNLRDQVKLVVDTMYDPRGGLMLHAAIYGEMPLRSIVAICDGYESCCF